MASSAGCRRIQAVLVQTLTVVPLFFVYLETAFFFGVFFVALPCQALRRQAPLSRVTI
jgi:hypothetical protein